MKLGTVVGLGPNHSVLDGYAGPLPPKKTQPSILAHAQCGQTARWIKIPLSTEVGLGPGDIVLDGDPAPQQRGVKPLNFRPMSTVAKRSPISATAERLLCYTVVTR